jgi:hypothetical protein|tara:strand:- start:1153 stop:1356 length:204 start_codon:yes stop_codon:yes gene_type:complete
MWIDFQHLKRADKKYFSHGLRVLIVSIKLLWLSLAGIIHAIFPFILLDTVTDGVKKISDQMEKFTRL